MCRVQRRIQKGFEVFEYYANNQWDFINENVLKLRDKLNARESALYQIHGDDMELDAYFESCVRAARVYILNEPPETLPAARRHMRVYAIYILSFSFLINKLTSYMTSCMNHI